MQLLCDSQAPQLFGQQGKVAVEGESHELRRKGATKQRLEWGSTSFNH